MKYARLFLTLCGLATASFSQDTFSIVAVDTLTGEIGSAGASCVSAINGVGAYIISDVIEGVGAIHTQASWLSSNQQIAHSRMLAGDSPQQIIDYMVAHDAGGNPTIRQYGVVDLTRRGESAAYTGVNCTDFKGHATGPGYAVQGNILLGQVIVDTIRNVFLRNPGPLADRLMASLEAAMIIGADTRCASRGTSSRSSFVKVVRLGDGNVAYLQKIIPDSPVNTDPIGLLRLQFNQWKDSLATVTDPFLSRLLVDHDSLPANGTAQAVITIAPRNNSDTLLAPGRTILLSQTGGGSLSNVTDLGDGTYVATLTAPTSTGTDTLSARVVSAGDTVRLAARPIIVYTNTTSRREDAQNVPDVISLEQNYPNPFNPKTEIGFRIAEFGRVSIRVYDMLGREVATLVNEERSAGEYTVQWDARGHASGVYVYRLMAGGAVLARIMVVLK